jgi:hypothetical protein
VRGGEDHEGRRPITMRTQPVGGGYTPTIAGYQTGKTVLGHRRREIVTNASLMFEKVSRDDGADCVTPIIFRPRRAAPVTVEAGDGVGAARL